jgi:hypothetical protein
MSSSFKEMMRRARTDAQDGDWSPGPGAHDAIVTTGDAFESAAGDVYAKTTLRLVKPGHPDDGRTWDHLMGFKSPQQASMSAGQLALYGLDGPTLDNLDDVEDLARAMGELEGLHVTVSCKAKRDGGGVWTNITGSRTGKSDVPDDQAAFSLGDNHKQNQPASAILGDDEPIPF